MSETQLEKVPIKIIFQNLESTGELVRVLSPRTVEVLAAALPLSSSAFLWKEEIYFETRVSVGPERPKPTVKPGDIAYWPPGKAFCIFYGNTQPYSPVNIVGRVTSPLEPLRKVRQGEWVKVIRAD
jgi:hypothetical protein